MEETELARRLDDILEVHLHPDARRWELSSDGSWKLIDGLWHPQDRLRSYFENADSRETRL